jgi:hypothetical protein
VWSHGSVGATGVVTFGVSTYLAVTQIPGTGASATQTICLPKWLRGTDHVLSFNMAQAAANPVCTNANARDFVFDDLAFVSDSRCTDTSNMYDNSFEWISQNLTTAPFWNVVQFPDTPGATAALKQNAATAHTGNVAAQLALTTLCASSSVWGSVTVPAGTTNAGPALHFWYRTINTVANSIPQVSMTALATSPMTLTTASGWTKFTACLQPALATRPDTLKFSISAVAGAACNAIPAEYLWIDDVDLTPDASCPTM